MTEYGGPASAEYAPFGSPRVAEQGVGAAAAQAATAEAAESAEVFEAVEVVEVVEADGVVEGTGVAAAFGAVETTAPTETAETADTTETTETVELVESAAEDDEETDEIPDAELEAQFEGPADPQEWIDQLVQELLHAEQGIGAGPRDALMARIKLAQAYSEFGDSVSAAPLAVENVLQAQQLFPASESWLRGLREFRDAVCEAAGWSAAQMRQAEPVLEQEPELERAAEPGTQPGGEFTQPDAEPITEPMTESAADSAYRSELFISTPYAERYAEPFADAVLGAMAADTADGADGFGGVDMTGLEDAVAAAGAESVDPRDDAGFADGSDDAGDGEFLISDAAAYEEIIRLRYELRDARRTIARLRHVNAKLQEALAFELD